MLNSLGMLFVILNKSDEKKVINIFDKYKVGFKVVMHGMGTASDSMLDYFGLDQEEKSVVTAVMPLILCKCVLKDLIFQVKFNEPGRGIAFCVPLSSATKYMVNFYDLQELEDIDMEEVNQHLIVTIVNVGNAEKVMTEAKKVGAGGGTTLSGRGLSDEKLIKFLNIAIEPEKDVVLILVPDEKREVVMKSIIDTLGLKTPGAGICFSLPVDYVAGLHNQVNE